MITLREEILGGKKFIFINHQN